MTSKGKATEKSANDDFVTRAQRAMNRAGEKAMADYKRFGIEPVIAPFPAKVEKKAK
jgi:hypothetical protein